MGAWKVKSTNKNDSGIAREEEAREGTKARLPQRSTIIAFPTAGNNNNNREEAKGVRSIHEPRVVLANYKTGCSIFLSMNISLGDRQ